jgi:hypothetical protein
MRRSTALATGLAFVMAFVLAPFQHVHTGPEGEHADAGEIHAHFFSHHTLSENAAHPASGAGFDDDDDDHAHARSLDTFTLRLPNSVPLYLPARAPAIAIDLVETVAPAVAVEERGHDPPRRCSAPRGPPL